MTDHTNEPTIVQLGTRAARRRPSMHPSRPGAAGRSTTAAELPRLLAIAEVADHLGVTVRHVRSLVAERRIPYLKWGHLLRFDADEVCAWLERARIHVHGDDPASIGAFATRPDLRTVRGRREITARNAGAAGKARVRPPAPVLDAGGGRKLRSRCRS